MVPEIDNWIINAGLVVSAVIVLVTALWKYLLQPVYEVSVQKKLDCISLKLEAFAEDIAAQLEKANYQLIENGGGSLKDKVNLTHKTLTDHIEADRKRAELLAAELKASDAALAAGLASTNAHVDFLLHVGHSERVRISEQIVEHDDATQPTVKDPL